MVRCSCPSSSCSSWNRKGTRWLAARTLGLYPGLPQYQPEQWDVWVPLSPSRVVPKQGAWLNLWPRLTSVITTHSFFVVDLQNEGDKPQNSKSWILVRIQYFLSSREAVERKRGCGNLFVFTELGCLTNRAHQANCSWSRKSVVEEAGVVWWLPRFEITVVTTLLFWVWPRNSQ